jgi:transcriptional regulator with XRE-family HTH domain
MRKTLRSPDHTRFIALLTAVRRRAGMTQHALAAKLHRAQSFVAKYENGERRIDIVEFVEIARTMGAEPLELFREFLAGDTQIGRQIGRKRRKVR